MLFRSDRAVLHRLVATADVVVENFRPGVAAKLGADYDTLKQVNPELIYLSSPGYGVDPELASAAAFDPLLQALGGVMHSQGGDDEPVFLTPPLHDVMAPMLGAFGVVAALNHRAAGHGGQRVLTSLAHATLAGVAIAFVNGANIGLGALGAAVLTALGIAWTRERARVSYDTAIGIVFVAMFSVGRAHV